MHVNGIDHYNLRAPRDLLEVLRDFYCTHVGLNVGPRPSFRSSGYWLYAGGKDVLHLTEAHPDEMRRPGVTAFDHVAFACSDAPGYIEHLRASDIDFEEDTVPETGQRQLFFRDPAGNGVELNFAGADAQARHLPSGDALREV